MITHKTRTLEGKRGACSSARRPSRPSGASGRGWAGAGRLAVFPAPMRGDRRSQSTGALGAPQQRGTLIMWSNGTASVESPGGSESLSSSGPAAAKRTENGTVLVGRVLSGLRWTARQGRRPARSRANGASGRNGGAGRLRRISRAHERDPQVAGEPGRWGRRSNGAPLVCFQRTADRGEATEGVPAHDRARRRR